MNRSEQPSWRTSVGVPAFRRIGGLASHRIYDGLQTGRIAGTLIPSGDTAHAVFRANKMHTAVLSQPGAV